MNSLRLRLILGFSLVAIVPVAIAMLVLSRRIEATVRHEAADRLDEALGVLETRLTTDGERALEKLHILAIDPTLRRLVLVSANDDRDLDEYLAEKRFLLGLDALVVDDTTGHMIADAARAPSTLDRSDRDDVVLPPAPRTAPIGLVTRRIETPVGLAMVASVPIRYQNENAGDVRGGIVLDDSLLVSLGQQAGLELILWIGDQPIASTLASRVARAQIAATPASGAVTLPYLGSYLARSTTLSVGAEPRPRLTGLVSTAAADRTVQALWVTSIVFGLLGLAVAIALGVLWSLQVSRPVERIARFSEQVAQGRWDEPLALRGVRELETLVGALDRMRQDLRGYRERLVAGERHAAWSQMARAVAHEVRNPLTPIAVSVADLKRSYDQRHPDFPDILAQAVATIGDEIESLKHILNEFSELGRFPEPQFASCRLSELWVDVETLYGREIAEGRLVVTRPAPDAVIRADRNQLRQALVNLIKNGLEAVEAKGRVEVSAHALDGGVEIAVADNGPGLSTEQRARLFVPHVTTKAHGSGLGLTIVDRIVNDHGGSITVDSAEGHGTTFRVRLPLDPQEDGCPRS
jgi:two-component system nitrogen regulation sensor histidine kinase NtrY